jgi:predicted molibdopterin-dependent oxidoreductase YjgC
MIARFTRLAETNRKALEFTVDGARATGLEGDTLLVAMLNHGASLRVSEFGDGNRAGFCLMGACQDCWVWSEAGERLRACDTKLIAGMRVVTRATDESWPTS